MGDNHPTTLFVNYTNDLSPAIFPKMAAGKLWERSPRKLAFRFGGLAYYA
jgi:hypothetical protein